LFFFVLYTVTDIEVYSGARTRQVFSSVVFADIL